MEFSVKQIISGSIGSTNICGGYHNAEYYVVIYSKQNVNFHFQFILKLANINIVNYFDLFFFKKMEKFIIFNVTFFFFPYCCRFMLL